MPVKIWDKTDGVLTSGVETSRMHSYRGERYRAEADALDNQIDRMLDHAVFLVSSSPTVGISKQAFVKRWALGRALAESKLTESKYLDNEEHKLLWRAIALKCRHGVRSDERTENSWGGLIPSRRSDPHRIERDVFAMGRWLQEQEIEEAMATFGASLTNAREIHRRGAINSLNLRVALARWFGEMTPTRRSELMENRYFVPLAKALSKRFPARGPGSAKRPVHYSDQELYEELCKVLTPLAASLVLQAGE